MLKVNADRIWGEEILSCFEDLVSEDILKSIREDPRYKLILNELEQLKSKLNSLGNNREKSPAKEDGSSGYEFYFQGLHDGMALADVLKECPKLILEYSQTAK